MVNAIVWFQEYSSPQQRNSIRTKCRNGTERHDTAAMNAQIDNNRQTRIDQLNRANSQHFLWSVKRMRFFSSSFISVCIVYLQCYLQPACKRLFNEMVNLTILPWTKLMCVNFSWCDQCVSVHFMSSNSSLSGVEVIIGVKYLHADEVKCCCRLIRMARKNKNKVRRKFVSTKISTK